MNIRKVLHLLILIALTALFPLTTIAQQLPNNGFENSWNTCTPWTGGYGTVTVGQNPENWCISHVMGITITDFVSAGTGKKEMGQKIAGYNSTSAAKVRNDETGAMSINRVVPGYITLGTTWSTAKGASTSTHDGGTWGGISFTYRPDAVSVMYQRAYGSSTTTENCSFVGYLWKGSTSQADVPITITALKNPKTTTMTNRDRNILSMNCQTGGTVTKSADFELIAQFIETEAKSVGIWTNKIIEFKYLTSSTPSSINLIFSANDYFNTAEATKDNSLSIDDVKLIYYSRLSDIKINGASISGFSNDIYAYSIDDYMPANPETAITYTKLGGGQSATVEIIPAAPNKVTVKVKGVDADADGETEHTYTLNFKQRPNPTITGLTINGTPITVSSTTIATGLPYIDNDHIVATGADGMTFEKSAMTIVDGVPTVTITVNHPDALAPATYTLTFLPYTAIPTVVKIGGKTVTVKNMDTDNWTIDEPLPASTADIVIEFAECSGKPTATFGSLTPGTPTLKTTLSNTNISPRTVTINFLPYIAQLKNVTLADGTILNFSESNKNATVTSSYSDAVKPVNYTSAPSSGKVDVSFGEIDPDNPVITVTVTNEYATPQNNTYTITYASHPSSRISGVSINGTTYNVGTDGTTIDASSRPLPMPEPSEITPIFIQPSTAQSISSLTSDTENGTITLTVTNSNGADYDGKSSHTYTIKFAKPIISRLATLTVGDLEFNPAFDSKTYEYAVSGWLPDNTNNVSYTYFDGSNPDVSITSSGDPFADAPTITVTVTNDAGADYDGQNTHTYTLKFNKRSNEYRSVKLSTITIGGSQIDGFSPDTYAYSIASSIPAESEIGYEVLAYENHPTEGTTVSVTTNQNAAKIVIEVSNSSHTDDTGRNTREYTLQFLPYYSRLLSITANGQTVETLDLTDRHITFTGQMPAKDAITLTLPTSTAGTIKTEIETDPVTATATVTVTNTAPDIDGESTHTYTLQFDKPYFSRLQSLSINGTPVEGFSPDKFDYDIDAQMPADVAIDAQYIQGGSGTPSIKTRDTNRETATVTITVANIEPDIDGLSEHTYTVRYNLPFFSRLDAMTVGGQNVALNHDGTPIAVDMQLPADDEDVKALFNCTPKPGSGTPEIAYDIDRTDFTVTITVTNSDKADIDGAKFHTYIIKFDKPYRALLSDIKIDGTTIDGFALETTDYTIAGQMPDISKITFTPTDDTSGKAIVGTPTVNAETAIVTVTVTNSGDDNPAYACSKTYTLHFDLPFFSRLASLSVNGTPIESFDKDTYTYTLTGALPNVEAIVAEPIKGSGEAKVTKELIPAEGIATITVKNNSGADLDGKNTHIYTLQFDRPVNSRLTSITIADTPVAGFSPDLFDYDLTTITLPEQTDITWTTGSSDATATMNYNEETATVTITVTAPKPDVDGLTTHTYTLRFKKAEEPTPPTPPEQTDDWTEYNGTLSIEMGGSYIAEGQPANVFITNADANGKCTFKLPDFTLDMDGTKLSLGDIVVENVTVATAEDGTLTYTGFTPAMSFLGGEIIADIDLKGTVSPNGDAAMTITVLWKQPDGSAIPINVVFNGKSDETTPPTPPEQTDNWTEYNGTLSIEMGGSYIAEGQPANVFITNADANGKCTFKLPDFTLDMDGTKLSLGDIVVENVTVATAEDGTLTYTGFTPAMSFLGGEIIADIDLKGTVSPNGDAAMTITVLWKQPDGSAIPINVVFNGKSNTIMWLSYPGTLTIALQGYDITEGGREATIKIAQTGDDGTYTFMLPEFSIALDSESEPANLGDITITGITRTSHTGYYRYTGQVDGMKLADGDITADVKINCTITPDGAVLANVDVVWIMDDGKRVPIMVRFSNTESQPATPVRVAYTGILTTNSANEAPVTHNVTIYITPVYDNRADLTITGIDFPTASKAASIGNSITVHNVTLTDLLNGTTAYDGAETSQKVREDMTLDITLHGVCDINNKFILNLDLHWLEAGIRFSGDFNGAEDASAIDSIHHDSLTNSDDTNAEYFNLQGIKMNPDNLTPGIYIKRSGGKTTKILIQ